MTFIDTGYNITMQHEELLNHLITSTKFTSNGETFYDEGILYDMFVAVEEAIYAVLDETSATDFMSEFYETLRNYAHIDPAFHNALIYSEIMTSEEIFGLN